MLLNSSPTPGRASLALLVWGMIANFLLVGPLWLRFGMEAGYWIAWEAWVLVAAFAALPDTRWTRALRWVVVIMLLVAFVFGIGDGATHQVLSRPLNAYFDIILISAGFNLLDGNIGRAGAVAVTVAVGLALLALTLLLARALRPGRLQSSTPARAIAFALAAVCLGAFWLDLTGTSSWTAARTPAWDTLAFQSDQIRSAHQARLEFAAESPDARQPGTPLPALADLDVLLVFIESYGVTVFDDANYRAIVEPRLQAMEPVLADAGLKAVSGLVKAPIRGGQSWLAHATALSGEWIDNQLWYRLLLDSHRTTLVDDFRATGHETVAVMPAIIRPWPEGDQYGFDRVYPAAGLDYAGPPLNWVTMPDQFTLHHFEHELRPAASGPLFAQIALISSHAPWTPVIDLEPNWKTIGDGALFERWRDAGEAPQRLWQDIERLRNHYARSVEYSVHVSLDYARHFVDENTLLILLGDHQPASLITGREPSAAVPVHVIAADPELLQPFRARGFRDGLLPEYPGPAAGMDQLRHWLQADFGEKKPGSRGAGYTRSDSSDGGSGVDQPPY